MCQVKISEFEGTEKLKSIELQFLKGFEKCQSGGIGQFSFKSEWNTI